MLVYILKSSHKRMIALIDFVECLPSPMSLNELARDTILYDGKTISSIKFSSGYKI